MRKAAFPLPAWKRAASRLRLAQRLLRQLFYNVKPLPDGSLFVTYDRAVGVCRGSEIRELDGLARPCRVSRLERASGERGELGEVDGPVYFSLARGDDFFFAVAAELCPSQIGRNASLWHPPRDGELHRLHSIEKDTSYSRARSISPRVRAWRTASTSMPWGSRAPTTASSRCGGVSPTPAPFDA